MEGPEEDQRGAGGKISRRSFFSSVLKTPLALARAVVGAGVQEGLMQHPQHYATIKAPICQNSPFPDSFQSVASG